VLAGLAGVGPGLIQLTLPFETRPSFATAQFFLGLDVLSCHCEDGLPHNFDSPESEFHFRKRLGFRAATINVQAPHRRIDLDLLVNSLAFSTTGS
jgi:hypothetical protein